MPDWTYHPFFKHLLFALPPEDGRRLTLGILEIQASSAAGRRLFRVFGHGLPPAELQVNVFGLNFPGPTGLGPGIDTCGTSLSVMQHLGFGFLEVGPVGDHAIQRRRECDPLRLRAQNSLVYSPHSSGPSAEQISERIKSTPDLRIPIGIALRGNETEIAGAITAASENAGFFTIPHSAMADIEIFSRFRSITSKPILVRLSTELNFDQLDALLDKLGERGLDGCVAVSGSPCTLLQDGMLDGPSITSLALKATEHIAKRYGEMLPVIGAGGLMTPGDALSMLDSGARLIELYAGLIFSGPGLPGRIVHSLEHRLHHESKHAYRNSTTTSSEQDDAIAASANSNVTESTNAVLPTDSKPSLLSWLKTHGWVLLAFTGWVLITSGIFAFVLASTIKMLPYDVQFLGMGVAELCAYYSCRVVHFMAHDRVSFGGSIIAIGTLYVWLACSPVRNGEAWAWWTFTISGILGFGSFLTYLGYGYLDMSHGIATLMLLPVYIAGLILSFSTLKGDRSIKSIARSGANAWLWSSAGKGRAALLFTATGMILGGLTIMLVGMTHVFVPQDLEFIGASVREIQAINPRLIPLIAHDRAGFGGGLCSTGVAILITIWCGARPGAKGLWWALLIAGVIGFSTAVGVHPIVGYMSFTHLLPAYIGVIAFTCGMLWLSGPMLRLPASTDAFPDFKQ